MKGVVTNLCMPIFPLWVVNVLLAREHINTDGIKQLHKCLKYLGAKYAITLEIIYRDAYHIFSVHILLILLFYFPFCSAVMIFVCSLFASISILLWICSISSIVFLRNDDTEQLIACTATYQYLYRRILESPVYFSADSEEQWSIPDL